MIYYKDMEFNSDNEFSIYLINQYMDKYFDNIADIDNIKKEYTPEQIAHLLGEKDISFFCLYYLRDIFVASDDNTARELAPVHYEIWDILNQCIEQDKFDKLNIVSPRGTSKTTTCDLALSTWLIAYKKSKFILLGAKKDTDATQFVDSIKKVFTDNKRIKSEFGELINSKKYKVNANEIEFTNDTYIRAVSSASSVRGANWKGIRPTTVIADDYQDVNDVLTTEATEKKYDKWCKEVEKVGDTSVYRNGRKIKKATKIISIGTVLHRQCLISRLINNKDYHTVIKRAVILDNNETIDDVFLSEDWLNAKKLYFSRRKDIDGKEEARKYYLEHIDNMKRKLLWEDKWDFFTDIAIPYWENRTAFMSEMMNDANLIGERWFTSVITESPKDIENHEFNKTMLCVDPASTTGNKADYTAMLVGSTSDTFYYIRKGIIEKLGFDDYINQILYLLKIYEDITDVYIERNTYQGSDVLRLKKEIAKDEDLVGRKLNFINEMQRKNKDNKISTIVDKVNNGVIIFNSEDDEFIDQIKNFQGQKYSFKDDAPDITAEFVQRIDNIKKQNQVVKVYDRKLLL